MADPMDIDSPPQALGKRDLDCFRRSQGAVQEHAHDEPAIHPTDAFREQITSLRCLIHSDEMRNQQLYAQRAAELAAHPPTPPQPRAINYDPNYTPNLPQTESYTQKLMRWTGIQSVTEKFNKIHLKVMEYTASAVRRAIFQPTPIAVEHNGVKKRAITMPGHWPGAKRPTTSKPGRVSRRHAAQAAPRESSPVSSFDSSPVSSRESSPGSSGAPRGAEAMDTSEAAQAPTPPDSTSSSTSGAPQGSSTTIPTPGELQNTTESTLPWDKPPPLSTDEVPQEAPPAKFAIPQPLFKKYHPHGVPAPKPHPRLHRSAQKEEQIVRRSKITHRRALKLQSMLGLTGGGLLNDSNEPLSPLSDRESAEPKTAEAEPAVVEDDGRVSELAESLRHQELRDYIDEENIELSASRQKKLEEEEAEAERIKQAGLELLRKKELKRQQKLEAAKKKKADAERRAREEAEELAAAEQQAREEEEQRLRREAEEQAEAARPSLLVPVSNDLSAWISERLDVKRGGTEVAKVGRTPIDRQDMNTLLSDAGDFQTKPDTKRGPAGWLNDTIINAYLESIVTKAQESEGYTPSRDKPAPYFAFPSQWHTTHTANGVGGWANWGRKAGLVQNATAVLQAKKIFLPRCDRLHWTVAIISPQDRTVEAFDSLGGGTDPNNNTAIGIAKDYLNNRLGKAFRESDWHFFCGRSARQWNATDCGMFTLLNSLAEVRGMSVVDEDMDESKMEIARHMVALTLLNKGTGPELDF